MLTPHRAEIDRLDREIIALLGKRFDVVHAVGELKAKHGISPVQSKRMQIVLDRVAALAQDHHLDPVFVQNLYRLMIDHAHSLEFSVADIAPDTEGSSNE
ncbi:MAG: chorismate mutase [Rhodospirillales bacterium]|nr:chorismate mutase [Rhodospirillales bacterium]